MYPKARCIALDIAGYDVYPGSMFKTHRQIIDAWPGRVPGFAADIDVEENHAKQMRKRNSIPSDYWLVVEAKGKARGVAVTLRDLARIKSKVRPRPRQRPDARAA